MRIIPTTFRVFLFSSSLALAGTLSVSAISPQAHAGDDPVVTTYKQRSEAILARIGCEAQFDFGAFVKSVGLGLGVGIGASTFATGISVGAFQVPIIMGSTILGTVAGPFLFYRDLKGNNPKQDANADDTMLADIAEFLELRSGDPDQKEWFQKDFEHRFKETDASIGLNGEHRPTPDATIALEEFQQSLNHMAPHDLPKRPYAAAINFALKRLK